jgi:uncharacterized membrane protein
MSISASKTAFALILAGILAAELAGAMSLLTAASASADDAKEECYRASPTRQNDCAAGVYSCAGNSTVEYDPASFKLVPTETCIAMSTPKGKGSLQPVKG